MRLVILCLFVILFSTGCATTKSAKDSIADNPSCRSFPASPMPGWITGSPSGNTKAYYGVGVSEGLDMSFAEMKSISRVNANTELAQSLEVRIQSSLREEVASTSGSDHKKTIEVIIESNSDLLISGAVVDSIWLNRESCQLWTRVKLLKKEAERSKKEMKSLVMRELERATKDVASIKETIESDPDVILRKYGLSISNPYYDYMRALNLGIEKEEKFKILDLYYQFGHIPTSVYDYSKMANVSNSVFYSGKIRPTVLPTILYTTLIDENQKNQSSLLLDYMSIKSIIDVGLDVTRLDISDKHQEEYQEELKLEKESLKSEREAINKKVALYEKSIKEKINKIPEVSFYYIKSENCFGYIKYGEYFSNDECAKKEEKEHRVSYRKYKLKIDNIKSEMKIGTEKIRSRYKSYSQIWCTEYQAAS